eukprot:TRINITY_DN11620_c0_g1_i1.p1 TRINITY_DN11620_c0_g1~~TRINITY_DN11620_c0_g1_i1.p1  ORF type:complete len:272 (+),score=63.96 TRINITY_DN11620_c0_g1_i1:32-847(+)
MEESTIEELEKQIEEYESQLSMINAALKEDPDSEEFRTIKKDMIEVLNITKDMLQIKKESNKPKFNNIQDVAAEKGIYVGYKCEAKWSMDGQWYKAVVTGISDAGIGVTFSAYGNSETVPPENIRERKKLDVVVVESGEKLEGAAIHVSKSGELIVPSSLKILPTDSEAVRKSKKKRIKHLKSQYRLQKNEEDQNKRKASWQDFKDNPNKKRKTESIFKSPETVTGKVGVTGSGKGMTEFNTVKYEPKKLNSTLPVGVTIKSDKPLSGGEY